VGFTAGDENLYRYVGNRPASRIDPYGFQEWPAGQGALCGPAEWEAWGVPGPGSWFSPGWSSDPAIQFQPIEFPRPVGPGPLPVGSIIGVPLFEPEDVFGGQPAWLDSFDYVPSGGDWPWLPPAGGSSGGGLTPAWLPGLSAGQQGMFAESALSMRVEPLTLSQPETTLHVAHIQGPGDVRVSLVLQGPAVQHLLNNDPAGFLKSVIEALPADLKAALNDPLYSDVRYSDVLAGFGQATWRALGPKVAFSGLGENGKLSELFEKPAVRAGAGGLLVGGTLWLNQQGGLQGLGVGELPGGGPLLSALGRPIPIRLWQRSWGEPDRLMFNLTFCALENPGLGRLGYSVDVMRIELGWRARSEFRFEATSPKSIFDLPDLNIRFERRF